MVDVTSEVGRLRKVLVHEPGDEVDRMVPAMISDLLFDDILYGERARDEHGRFRRVLQLLGIEVIEANDLLTETLDMQEARSWVIDVLLQDLAVADREQLQAMPAADLAQALVAGSRPKAHPVGAAVEDLYTLPPLPNWCFQRDPQIVMGQGVVHASMATAARHRESMLSRTVFRFHPSLSSTPVLCDPIAADTARPSLLDQERPQIEGGDVLVLSPDVVAVGLSERTNRVGLRRLVRALARRDDGPRWILAMSIPKRRAYMHLDTLITPVDRDACLVYPPVISAKGTEHASVYEIDLHAKDPVASTHDSLLDRLAAHGLDYEPIACGGDDPVAQQREQWTDGANALALAPGVITLYARNLATADELDRHGFRLVEAEDLLLGRAEVDLDEAQRVCILLSSTEISRARGGPHCLSHPLLRDAP